MADSVILFHNKEVYEILGGSDGVLSLRSCTGQQSHRRIADVEREGFKVVKAKKVEKGNGDVMFFIADQTESLNPPPTKWFTKDGVFV